MSAAETAGHARKRDAWLNHWLYAAGASAKELVASVVMAVRQHEEKLVADSRARAGASPTGKPTGIKRSRKQADRERLDAAVELVVCNLAYAVFKKEGTGKIAYSRRKCLRPSRYDNPVVFAELFLTAVDTLGRLGLLETALGSLRDAKSTFAPSDCFRTELAAFGVSIGDLGLRTTEEVIILKSRIDGFGRDGTAILRGAGRRVPYTDTPATRAMRSDLHKLNDFIASADLAFLGDGAEPEVNTNERRLRRYFAFMDSEEPRFDLGGRLFGGWWQNLQRSRREHIRIEGEVCCLLDYSSMFPHLAYACQGLQAPSGELYDLKAQWPAFDLSLHRKATKEVFSSLFFGRQRLDSELKECLPRKATMAKVRGAVAAKHPKIASLLGSTVGYRLMMDESCIMVAVLGTLRDRGIVALPIHDGLMVKQSEEAEAKSVMMSAAYEYTSCHIPVSVSLLSNERTRLEEAA